MTLLEKLDSPYPSPNEYRWIPTLDLAPGMVVARPAFGGPGNRVTMHIAVGSLITADTIAQFINKGIECVAVYQDVPADEAARAEEVQRYEERLTEIFGAQPNKSCSRLLHALQADGPPKC